MYHEVPYAWRWWLKSMKEKTALLRIEAVM